MDDLNIRYLAGKMIEFGPPRAKDDPGDCAGLEAVSQHGAQGSAIGGDGVFLRVTGSAAAEARTVDGRARSAAGGER